ncbi:plancitoxin-1-like isoform X2 [Macrosteles quadrilineatus]|uniref:plancitoxin-1-like isoform X2 n=1 Tax=Macrosteles quadrilineatus TaxID=74068 RepID=UPI0023E220F9|nr:plancitoxin-1-like isoform X2 [Macrosteles quadrilineatus]
MKDDFCFLAVTLVFSLIIVLVCSVKHTCRDERNHSVAWFVVYKLPRLPNHDDDSVKHGKAYAYITSRGKIEWKLSEKSVQAEDTLLGNTFSPLYEEKYKRNLLYFMYNDKPPTVKESYRGGGHAKGVVAGDKTGGFWMVHSVPNYISSTNNKYTYPDTGLKFGQSFLCITLKPKDLELAGQLMQYNELHIYDKSIPNHLKKIYKNLINTAEGEMVDSETLNSNAFKTAGENSLSSDKGIKNYFKWFKSIEKGFSNFFRRAKEDKLDVKSEPGSISDVIRSAGGKHFRVFAKSPSFNKELYSYWVAPALQVDLLVQTWARGRSHQDSSCEGKFKVENVEKISVVGVEFPTTNDHSKWAVSDSQTKPWICVGDINKDDSQKRRGGGTVCIKNKSLWKAYHTTVIDTDSCRK